MPARRIIERVAKTGTERGVAGATEHAKAVTVRAPERDRMNVVGREIRRLVRYAVNPRTDVAVSPDPVIDEGLPLPPAGSRTLALVGHLSGAPHESRSGMPVQARVFPITGRSGSVQSRIADRPARVRRKGDLVELAPLKPPVARLLAQHGPGSPTQDLALFRVGEWACDPARPTADGHRPTLDLDGAVHFGFGSGPGFAIGPDGRPAA